LIELRCNIPLDTKQVILEMLFPANLLASTEKQNHAKGNPDLVASYDFRPGNGAGLSSKKKISNEVIKYRKIRED